MFIDKNINFEVKVDYEVLRSGIDRIFYIVKKFLLFILDNLRDVLLIELKVFFIFVKLKLFGRL